MKPREKILQNGISKLTNSELISVILGSGSAKKSVFNLAKEVEELLSVSGKMPDLGDLCRIEGVGLVKACQILACLELSGRFLLGMRAKSIHCAEDLIPCLSFLKTKSQESMVSVSLNGANQILGVHQLTTGLANQTQIHSREAFAAAIQDRALAVIFAHNHPSGSLSPSADDLEVTRVLVQSGKILGIPVLDHLILSPRGWTSLKMTHGHLFSG